MLILTRKKNESIIIDEQIKVTILELDNNRVQVGIEAPRDISIHREEVYLEIQEENRKAALARVDLSLLKESLSKGIEEKEKKSQSKGG
ncbi:MAG: carbon storage regulator CsrA [Halanaerobiales bacterium]|jgi:carbon storage regulator|nr:carbon storage regulator CsrA [Halanaerobiales bacterium]HPZ63402.1 carbon storage regulator CsrA [Halanaerobiales bacterium]HQD04611.1 carbon storage regulator CsrA [Halanaerobiales bacterium]